MVGGRGASATTGGGGAGGAGRGGVRSGNKRRSPLLRAGGKGVSFPSTSGPAAASDVYNEDYRRRHARLHHHHVLQNETAWSVMCSSLSWKMLSVALVITLVLYAAILTTSKQPTGTGRSVVAVQNDAQPGVLGRHGAALSSGSAGQSISGSSDGSQSGSSSRSSTGIKTHHSKGKNSFSAHKQRKKAGGEQSNSRIPGVPESKPAGDERVTRKGCSAISMPPTTEVGIFFDCNLKRAPSRLEQLTRLQLLDLGRNGLTTVPQHALSLPQLEILFLSGNEIASVEADALAAALKLRVLSLKGNRLATFDGRAASPHLEQLILTDNKITELVDLTFRRTNLRKLMLTRNSLNHLPRDFTGMRRLELVRLSHNELTALPAGMFSMPRLCWVALAGNPVLGQAPASQQPQTIDASQLRMGEVLGEGTSGVVHRGTYKGAAVAVKLFKSQSSDGSFWDEMAIAKLFRHPNITAVHGIITKPQPGMVLEYLSDDFQPLASPPDAWTTLRCTYPAELELTPQHTLAILAALADALAHVHSHQVAHGDIYAHNILYNPNTGEVRLSDFGAAWSYANLPPSDHPLIERQEMRAFGILIKELLARTHFSTSSHVPIRRVLSEVAQDCTLALVARRPSFAHVANTLTALM
ncbi:serine/threonine protein kinase [Salpingoeca rosetta]|uniref:Serine/threonine protein kinase n=1 Tax=Salpingoeca rosetta (strain ATCC 50818 / BSB-021) TaxID=946362 RepID=F2UE84_SALR5|nr:serine/threonine protein kinase [Salpingoeca rosetta]EGD74934.1 serine/threonine protein kinase [Salpingoeca rosetta]|eukprot:XP_004992579.1 serine/threonine protein kinase [Salpingoeca rosetta]